MRASFDLFAAKIAQHGATLLAVFQARMQRAQVRRKRGDVMVVVAGISAQVFARQLTGRPRFVIRMAEKVIARNALLERRQKSLQFHESPHEKFRPEKGENTIREE